MPFFTASISRRNHLKRARIAKAILRDATSHNRTKSRLRLFRARAVLFAANFFSARCASSRSVFSCYYVCNIIKNYGCAIYSTTFLLGKTGDHTILVYINVLSRRMKWQSRHCHDRTGDRNDKSCSCGHIHFTYRNLKSFRTT